MEMDVIGYKQLGGLRERPLLYGLANQSHAASNTQSDTLYNDPSDLIVVVRLRLLIEYSP